MTFGNNSLVLSYSSSSSNSASPSQASKDGHESSSSDERVTIAFNALDALGQVAVGEGWEERVGGGVRVAMADKWGKNRYVSAFVSSL